MCGCQMCWTVKFKATKYERTCDFKSQTEILEEEALEALTWDEKDKSKWYKKHTYVIKYNVK